MLSVGVSEMAAAVEKWELSLDEQLQDPSVPEVIITHPVLIVMSSTHWASEAKIINFLDNHSFPVDQK